MIQNTNNKYYKKLYYKNIITTDKNELQKYNRQKEEFK